jgi:hypothetical protein
MRMFCETLDRPGLADRYTAGFQKSMSGRKLLLSTPDTDSTGLTPDRVASAAPETVEAKSSMQDIQEACISAKENLEKLGYLNFR